MSSPITFHELDTLLRGNISWTIIKDDFVITHNGRDHVYDTTRIPLESMNALHPQLPATLKALRVEINKRMRRDYDGDLRRDHSDGRYPRACIRHLCAPLVVQDVKGYEVAIACVWDISWTSADKRVMLHTMSYDLPPGDASGKGVDVFLPDRVSSQHVRVTQEWMEATYPGWENRLHSAQALGLKADDLVDHVCPQQAPVRSTAPPGDITPG